MPGYGKVVKWCWLVEENKGETEAEIKLIENFKFMEKYIKTFINFLSLWLSCSGCQYSDNVSIMFTYENIAPFCALS